MATPRTESLNMSSTLVAGTLEYPQSQTRSSVNTSESPTSGLLISSHWLQQPAIRVRWTWQPSLQATHSQLIQGKPLLLELEISNTQSFRTVIVTQSYTLRSSYFSNKVRITESFTGGFINHSPLSLQGPIMAASVVLSEFSTDAFNDLNGGYTTCHNGVTGRIKVQKALSIPQPAEASSVPTATQAAATRSASHAAIGGISTLLKILLGVLVTVGGIGCLVLLTFILLKYRKRRRRLLQHRHSSMSPQGDAQPYLQRKAELEDIGNRRSEMAGNHRMYEMQAPGIAQEVSAGGRGEGLPSLSLRHELVGEEFVKELEGIA